jgi:hypothetical protein
MPKIFRAMLIDGEKPKVAQDKKSLGVLVGPGPDDDIDKDSDGNVHPSSGGMSVSPSLDLLPMHRVPRRLSKKYSDRFGEATGSNRFWLWLMGDGQFEAGRVAAALLFRPDPDMPTKHGYVEPDRKMLVAEYAAALAATRDQWQRWEE